MGVEENKRIVINYFDDMNAGNYESYMGALADDATWWVQGNFPLSGTMTKKELSEFYEDFGSKIDGNWVISMIGITAENDRVAVEAKSHAKMKNGKIHECTYHYLFVIRDGKIQSVREYLDTLHTNYAFYG